MGGDTSHMKVEGEMVEILTKLDPKIYWKYIRTEKGKFVLYVELKGTVWPPLGGPVFLEESNLQLTVVGI